MARYKVTADPSAPTLFKIFNIEIEGYNAKPETIVLVALRCMGLKGARFTRLFGEAGEIVARLDDFGYLIRIKHT